MIRIFLFFMTTLSLLWSAPALSRVKTFTQPDGTEFEGILKGNSALHWIESDGEIIVADPKDGFYKRAIIRDNKLIPTDQKPLSRMKRSSRLKHNHALSKEKRDALRRLRVKVLQGSHPY